MAHECKNCKRTGKTTCFRCQGTGKLSGQECTYCDGCGKDYDTVPQGRICPHCGSDKTWLKTGNEVNIKDITIV